MNFVKIKNIRHNNDMIDFYHLSVKKNENFFGNGICLHNCSYRGDLSVLIINLSENDYEIKKGERIAQLVVYPLISAQCGFCDEPLSSNRGEKGFGSSGL